MDPLASTVNATETCPSSGYAENQKIHNPRFGEFRPGLAANISRDVIGPPSRIYTTRNVHAPFLRSKSIWDQPSSASKENFPTIGGGSSRHSQSSEEPVEKIHPTELWAKNSHWTPPTSAGLNSNFRRETTLAPLEQHQPSRLSLQAEHSQISCPSQRLLTKADFQIYGQDHDSEECSYEIQAGTRDKPRVTVKTLNGFAEGARNDINTWNFEPATSLPSGELPDTNPKGFRDFIPQSNSLYDHVRTSEESSFCPSRHANERVSPISLLKIHGTDHHFAVQQAQPGSSWPALLATNQARGRQSEDSESDDRFSVPTLSYDRAIVDFNKARGNTLHQREFHDVRQPCQTPDSFRISQSQSLAGLDVQQSAFTYSRPWNLDIPAMSNRQELYAREAHSVPPQSSLYDEQKSHPGQTHDPRPTAAQSMYQYGPNRAAMPPIMAPDHQYINPYMFGVQLEHSTVNDAQLLLPPQHVQQMVPYMMPAVPRNQDVDPVHGERSALLNEFKTSDKSSRRWELCDVYEHITEFCGDQQGSKFIQGKLQTANSDQKERIFRELLPNAIQLMNDVFGNWVMQLYFIHGDQNQKKILAAQMKNKVLSLSKHMYGCRVLQKALKYVLEDQKATFAKELEGHVMILIRDANGNHVIQKILKRVKEQYTKTIVNTCVANLPEIAFHAYGCRVVQRLLRHYDGPQKPTILRILHDCAQSVVVDKKGESITLISDQFGNYVVQHIIEKGSPEDRDRMMGLVCANLVSYAKQKFSSNAVEKCIIFGTEEQRRDIMMVLGKKDCHGEVPLHAMIHHIYGNYVIQKLLDTLNDENFAIFVQMLGPEIARMRYSAPNKQAENVQKKMFRREQQTLHYQYRLPPPTVRADLNENNSPMLTPPSSNDDDVMHYFGSRL